MGVLVLLFPTWFKLRYLNHVGFSLVISNLVQVKISDPCGSSYLVHVDFLLSPSYLVRVGLLISYLVQVNIFELCGF